MPSGPLTFVPYDYLGGAPLPTLAAGQYTVDGSGTYHFSAADAGQTVLITDSFFYNNRITQEAHVVPTAAPFQFQADEGGQTNDPYGHVVDIFKADYGVRYYASGSPLTPVSQNPAPGQYAIDQSGGYGTYVFSGGDAGVEVIINYEYYNYNDDLYAPPTLGVTFFPGVLGQQAWGYLETTHPDQSVAYSEVAYAAFEHGYLGMSATPPAHSYEVIGFNQRGGGNLDASPIDCLTTLLTDPDVGIGFPSAVIDAASWYTLANSAQAWVLAQQFYLSQALTNQEPVAQVASRWLEAFQIAACFSEGRLKLIPFGDQAASSSDGSYTPATTIVASFTDDDYLVTGQEDPVTVTRSPWTDAYNRVQVTYTNRFNAYNSDLVYEQDEASIARFGLRLEPPVSYDFLMSETVAAAVANLRVKRNVTVRNQYTFTVPIRYEYVEPMDLVAITDTRLGITALTVRVTKTANDLHKGLTITAEDYPGNGYAMPVVNPKATTPAGHPTYWSAPALQTVGIILQPELPAASSIPSSQQSMIRLYVYATGNNANWGGCVVWASLDGTTYNQIATVTQPARIYTLSAPLGTLAAAPTGSYQTTFDATDSLQIQGVVTTNATPVGIPAWTPPAQTPTYPKGAHVLYDNRLWARTAAVAGNDTPTSSNPNWQEVSATPPAGSALSSVTPAAAENLVTLSAILAVSSSELTNLGIELLSYETVQAGVLPNTYTLTDLYRAAFNTYGTFQTTDPTTGATLATPTPLATQSFGAGAYFVRMADASTTYDVPAGYAGQTIYFRFTAFNTAGGGTQDVGTAQTYAFTVAGPGQIAGLEFGGLPSGPNADQIGLGVRQGLVNVKYLTPNQVVDNFLGPWFATTPYLQGDEVSYSGNYWKALRDNVDSIPQNGNTNWILLGPITADHLVDGEFYYSPSAGIIKVADLPYNGYFDIWPAPNGVPAPVPEGWEGTSFGLSATLCDRASNDGVSVNGGGAWMAALNSGVLASRPFGVTAGQKFQIFGWAQAANGPGAITVAVYYFSDPTDIEASSPFLIGAESYGVSLGAGAWTPVTVTTVGLDSTYQYGAPSGAAVARLVLQNTSGAIVDLASWAVLPQAVDTLAVEVNAITDAVLTVGAANITLVAGTWVLVGTAIAVTVDRDSAVVIQVGGVFENTSVGVGQPAFQAYRGATQAAPIVGTNTQGPSLAASGGEQDFVAQFIDNAPTASVTPVAVTYSVWCLPQSFSGLLFSAYFVNVTAYKR